MFEGMILDGHNRYRACLTAKVEPTFGEFTGTEPRPPPSWSATTSIVAI